MKTKQLNYESGITYFLTKSKDSYTTLASTLSSKMEELGSDRQISEERVKQFANGTTPHGLELDAICLAKFSKEKSKLLAIKKWKELYFPSNYFTLNFIQQVIPDLVDTILEDSKIDSFIKERDLFSLYKGVKNKSVTVETLTSILIMKIYLELRNKDLLCNLENKKYDFQNYKDKIMSQLVLKLSKIRSDSLFIKQTKKMLMDTLDKDNINKANIKRITLKQLIITL
jgi:hypothetical protein